MLSEPSPALRLERPLWRTFLVLQTGLVLTGGAVRLTKSGLGCPTWPQCVPGSLTPQSSQLEGVHSWIEFGNRLLTILLVVNVVALFVIALRNRRILGLATLQVFGIIAQIVLGGITVLTHLNPASVAGHYLLSSFLIAGIVTALKRLDENAIASAVRFEVYALSRAIYFLTAIVLVVGTVVTGSGPHAGDAYAPRYPFDAARVAILHADLVIVLVVATVGLWLVLRITDRSAPRALYYFSASIVLQGIIGYVQYFTGLPEVIVLIHLLGSGLVWVAANFLLHSIDRENERISR